MPSSIVVTNCTTRKRASQVPVTLGSASDVANVRDLAVQWRDVLAKAPLADRAGAVYQGRSISDSLAVAKAVDAEVFVVSAGLGLVHVDQPIPNYDLTVAMGSGSVSPILKTVGAGASDWWLAMANASGVSAPLSALLAARPASQVLVALPSSYLDMIAADLSRIPEDRLANLFIFTSPSGQARLAGQLQACAMPYDDRLEAVKGYAGTRSDFPQRAMRHFVEHLNGLQLTAQDARLQVLACLSQLSKPALPERSRATDAEIRQMLRDAWSSHRGSSTQLLRYLRDSARVSCEQRRFRDLWQDLRSEMRPFGT